jgi:four helix bundle protein
MTSEELENRVIDFAVLIVEITEKMPKSYAANYYAQQLLRSGSSPALNYGEVRAAESKRDFIHKMNVVLKELRESRNCLKIIERTGLYDSEDALVKANKECKELLAIFVASVNTAKKNIESK